MAEKERLKPPLWRCPECEREFANRNQSHACGRYTLEHHFEGRDPAIRELFDAFVHELERIGEFRILPEKTRIAFQVRMSFAQLSPRREHVDGHLVLARRLDSPSFRTIDKIGNRYVHHFRLTKIADVAPLTDAIREAYAVGEQRVDAVSGGGRE